MKIRENIAKYYEPVVTPGGYEFDTAKTIKKNYAYYDGHFLSGERDNIGVKKDFFNIIKSTCDIASKFVDLDTSNILFLSENGLNSERVWLMTQDFKTWVKDSDFAELLNELKTEFPKGHFVIKKTKRGKWERVPIMNIRTHPGIKSLNRSPFVNEVLDMTKSDIEDMNWDNEENIKELFGRDDERQNFVIYECYTKVGSKWKRRFVGDVFSTRKGDRIERTPESMSLDRDNEEIPELVLHEDEVTELPYRELKWEERDGRWLGFGFIEYLYPNQMRRNEIKHLEKISMYLKAMQVYISNDDNIGNNILKDVINGQIIKTSGRLEPIPRDNVDLSAYQLDSQDWDSNITKKTFDTDIVRGDKLPSQTPLGLGQLQAQMTISYFEGKQEEFGLFIKKLLYEDIIPSFKKNRKQSHRVIIRRDAQEYEKFAKLIIKGSVERYLSDYMKRNGAYPSPDVIQEEEERIQQEMTERDQVDFEVPEDYYKDVKASIEIVITGESTNTQNRFVAFQNALQIIAQSPQVIANPATRRLFFKTLELQGVPSMEIGLLDELAAQNANQILSQAQPQQAQQAKPPQQAQPQTNNKQL